VQVPVPDKFRSALTQTDRSNYTLEVSRMSNVLTNRHHPKPSEVIHTEWCRLPRSSDTSKWQVYWPSGSSGGSSGSSSQSTGSSSSVQLRLGSCSASSPCDECEGDCDERLSLQRKPRLLPKGRECASSGCEGNDASKSDYSVYPQNL
jgi:hypothetical protein